MMETSLRTRKRKSPIANSPIFRSPLSRMMLSLRIRLSPMVRSPSTTCRISPSVNLGSSLSPSAAMLSLGQGVGGQRVLANLDLNAGPLGEEMSTEPYIGLDLANDVEGGQENAQGNARVRACRKEVKNDVRRAIFDALLVRARNGNLKGHETMEVSLQFDVHLRTVRRIWEQGKDCLDKGIPVNVSNARSNCGRKEVEVDLSMLSSLPVTSHGTLEDVSNSLEVSKTKLHRLKKEGKIQRVSNTVKPYLTDHNKKERLKWCLSMLESSSIPHNPVFKDLFDFVFIDEKWFDLSRRNQKYYKIPGEIAPVQTCKHKNHIPKIMILTAVARPRFSNGICVFDGKIGCWPFVTYEPAKDQVQTVQRGQSR